MTDERALAVAPRTGIVLPAVDTEGAVAAWNAYVALCKAVIGPEDIQKTWDGDFRKKSAFRKLARFYDLTDKVVDSEIQRDDRGRPIFAAFTVRATAPNGREAEGYHECHLSERCCPAAFEEDCYRADKPNHHCCKPGCTGWPHWSHPGDIPATAHTRAKNRAISDLIGAGEVSAEEVGDIGSEKDEAVPAPAQDAPRGYCPDHPAKPFVERKSKDGGTWRTCGTKVGEKDGKALWCQRRPAAAPATQPAAPAGVVDAAPVAQVPEVVPPPAPEPPKPKTIAEMMQRAKTDLHLPWVEARAVVGDPGMIVDIPAAWAKLCEAAKAKE